MWSKLRKQITVERKHLNGLIDVHRPLLVKCVSTTPDGIEISALAAMLHAFYTGIENVFKRVTVELGTTLPRGEFWHRELLDAMTHSTEVRPPVISMSLRDRLKEYLDFRHFFRQAYTFQLRWEKMSLLVLDCEKTLRLLESELDIFLQTGEQKDQT
ncbi:MAG: hypothetical protein A3F84_08675 [Candidatus Handelsmanbacteria bacterium RIFCSPLOWO2_12_FULL_64_10]|uniref:HepT-like domain-containing protein n=1 Tax=Handelsmanbacteria sp. (strain RIFCSPLOWO2_12_FULL_64_10) TaxID=1817868 RepID=A0A1F6CQR7_HANXR|nr:MAG: hypothetical protein A3F84_08675 [Candidatus Handelsmanbacteria bacterium RIFCSPLOWO2_12_FULL_64_10]